MAAISAGEFERIFKEFYKPLCLFALRFTEKTEDAEDVVQQVFADVWDKNSHDMVIANFKSYLYQAVRNRSLTLIAQSSDMLQTTECIADIEDLSEEEQILVGLSVFGGYCSQEIGEMMRLNPNTVRSKRSRALKKMECVLDSYGEDEKERRE